MDFVYCVLESISNFLSFILIPLLIFAGIYFTFKTRFVQFRLFKDALKSLLYKPKNLNKNNGASPFKSLMVSMASRVGVGQIAGIAFAIHVGGTGAIFWMWVMALFGCTSAFIESTLAQIYKVKNTDTGEFRGGPAYYINKALGKKWLGTLFSLLIVGAYAYGFNMIQSFQLASSFEYCVPNFKHTIYPFIVGVILSVITALVIFGGTHKVAFVSAYVVPIMSLVYILLASIVTIKNFNKIPSVFKMILDDAFSVKAIFTAPFSLSYLSPLIHGIKRGLFSNEAGMGSAPNAAAAADVPHPVMQGFAQLISVFIDTMLICTSTALIVLLSGVDFKQRTSQIFLVQSAIRSQVGDFGVYVIIFAVLTFAFTSIIGNYSYAETNVIFIKNSKKVLNIFRITCVLFVFLGTLVASGVAWSLADIFMSLMAIVNIMVILKIGNKAILALKDYIKQKSLGKKEFPVFVAKNVGITGSECWGNIE